MRRRWSMNGGRPAYVALALATIAIGLLVHSRGGILPPPVRDSVGDALWAMMICWWIGALVPKARLGPRAALALAICWTVEFSQLYHAVALDRWRLTPLGQLTLGTGFDVRDLAAYGLGVLTAVILETTLHKGQKPMSR